MESLVEKLAREGVLKTPRIIEAFRAVDRGDFVLSEHKDATYRDEPLPIGYGQTISQPYTVAFMLELLQPEEGNGILDVGSGSGWTTALLSHIVGSSGHVTGIERIPKLADAGARAVERYGFISAGVAEIHAGNAEGGFPKNAPYDRIVSGASSRELPGAWEKELAKDGRIVLPIETSIWLFTKAPDGSLDGSEYPGFAFVPLISNN